MVTFNPFKCGLKTITLRNSWISSISKLTYSASIFSLSNFSLKNFDENECCKGYPINPNVFILHYCFSATYIVHTPNVRLHLFTLEKPHFFKIPTDRKSVV